MKPNRFLFAALTLTVSALGWQATLAEKMSANTDTLNIAKYDQEGKLILPENFAEWIFIGAPLTPNGLNGGNAGFPEFHHVYIHPDAYEIYKTTGEFPEGTVIAKELVLLQEGEHTDGSRMEASGRGFFAGALNGMDVMVKDHERYRETNGWGFFNFGHHAPPYLTSATAAPSEACAACHQANSTKDMVFTQFYPILRD